MPYRWYTGRVSSAPSLTPNGYCLMSDVLAPDRVAALLGEAASMAADAGSMPRDVYRVNDDQSISSPRRMHATAGGPVLRAIQRDEALLDMIEHAAGHRVAPTRAAYIFYEPGDYLGLHRDSTLCEVTLLTGVGGALDPLIVHPELVGLPAEELLYVSRAHDATPPGGVGAEVPAAGSFLMLSGSKVPHHRPPASRHGSVATLCFA